MPLKTQKCKVQGRVLHLAFMLMLQDLPRPARLRSALLAACHSDFAAGGE